MDNTRSGNLELHPLENPVVLEKIFEWCGIKNRKNFRLVCRAWRDASLLTWRSSAVARIDHHVAGRTVSDFEIFSRNYENREGQIMEVPFTNFHLVIEDSRWHYTVWGSSMKILQLTFVKFESRNVFLKTILNCCPNLEQLALIWVLVDVAPVANKIVDTETIDWNDIQENKKLESLCLDNSYWEGIAWMEFLSRLPSLQALILIGSASNNEELFLFLKAIREEDPEKLKLKLVKIKILDLSPAILPVLLDTGLHLEFLSVGQVIHCFSDPLPEILNNHASSLKRLSISGNVHVSGPNHFRFRNNKQLEILQELGIQCLGGKAYPLMEFLRLAPNLKKVVILSSFANHLALRDLDLSSTQDIRLNFCNDLNLVVPDLTAQDLKPIISWIPNLKKLKINGLNNQSFAVICDGWPKLVMLEAQKCMVNESGITGLDAEDVEEINRNGERAVWRPITVPRANIAHLKDLQILNLKAAKDQLTNPDLGYCAIVCGIDLMPNLKHLNVEHFIFRGRADAYWKDVRAQYPWVED